MLLGFDDLTQGGSYLWRSHKQLAVAIFNHCPGSESLLLKGDVKVSVAEEDLLGIHCVHPVKVRNKAVSNRQPLLVKERGELFEGDSSPQSLATSTQLADEALLWFFSIPWQKGNCAASKKMAKGNLAMIRVVQLADFLQEDFHVLGAWLNKTKHECVSILDWLQREYGHILFLRWRNRLRDDPGKGMTTEGLRT